MKKYSNLITYLQVLTLFVIIITQSYLGRDLYAPFVVIVGFLAFISSLKNIKLSYFRFVLPLLLFSLIGVGGIIKHEFRDIARDIVFALFPVALIFIGYWLGGNKKFWPYIYKIFAVCAFILTVNHLSTFVINPSLLSNEVYTIRKEAGGIGSLSVLVMVLGLLKRKLDLESPFPKFLPASICMPLLLISFVLSFSRTQFILMIILILALLGLLNKIRGRSIFAAFFIVSVGFTLVVTTPDDEVGTFRSKVVRSFDEITVSDYFDMQDINENWRGFESKRALESFSSGTILDQSLGQGFGALVDLGFYMELAGESLRFIPILHNGYLYILIKTGLLGLACYLFFYIKTIRYAIRYCDARDAKQVIFARLLLGCILSLIFSMFVVGGMAESGEAGLILLLGYLMQRIELLKVMRYEDSVRKNGVVI